MTNFEIEILNKIRNSASSFFDSIFKSITNLGGQEILILVIIIIYFIFSKKLGQRIAFAIFGSLLINNSLKVIIDRIRPFHHPNSTYTVQEEITASATGQSFPSGHAQNSACTYSAVSFTYKKKYLWYICISLVSLVAISRVMLGVHYPSDVIIGSILGFALAYFGTKLHEKYENNFNHLMILYLSVAIIFLPFIFIYMNKAKTNYIAYKDLFTIYGFYLGYVLAIFIEKKLVDFNEQTNLKYRIIRAVIAIFIVMGLLLGLKALFPKDNIFFDMLRYFLLSFIGLGIYPLIAKKILFTQTKL